MSCCESEKKEECCSTEAGKEECCKESHCCCSGKHRKIKCLAIGAAIIAGILLIAKLFRSKKD